MKYDYQLPEIDLYQVSKLVKRVYHEEHREPMFLILSDFDFMYRKHHIVFGMVFEVPIDGFVLRIQIIRDELSILGRNTVRLI